MILDSIYFPGINTGHILKLYRLNEVINITDIITIIQFTYIHIVSSIYFQFHVVIERFIDWSDTLCWSINWKIIHLLNFGIIICLKENYIDITTLFICNIIKHKIIIHI